MWFSKNAWNFIQRSIKYFPMNHLRFSTYKENTKHFSCESVLIFLCFPCTPILHSIAGLYLINCYQYWMFGENLSDQLSWSVPGGIGPRMAWVYGCCCHSFSIDLNSCEKPHFHTVGHKYVVRCCVFFLLFHMLINYERALSLTHTQTYSEWCYFNLWKQDTNVHDCFKIKSTQSNATA